MSVIAEVRRFLNTYETVDKVLSSGKARSEMSSVLVKLDIDPNTSCNGCVRGKYIHLQSIVKKEKLEVMAKKPGYPGRRYVLPEGKAVRPFGAARYYSNADLTDEMILAFDKKNPGFINNFIDTHELADKQAAHEQAAKDAEPPVRQQKESGLKITSRLSGTTDGEAGSANEQSLDDTAPLIDYEQENPERYYGYMEGYTNQQLKNKLEELVGQEVPGRPSKRTLVFAILKEEAAIEKLNK